MTKRRLTRILVGLIVLTTGLHSDACADDAKKDWRLVVLPASVNSDRTIRLVANHSQPLVLQLQAFKEITAADAEHEVSITFNLPTGMQVLITEGMYHLKNSHYSESDNRIQAKFDFLITKRDIVSEPNARPNSEWRAQAFVISAPESLQEDQAYVEITLAWRGKKFVQKWPLEIMPLNQLGSQPQLTRVALWSYNYGNTSAASNEVGEFLSAVGVTHIQKCSDQFHDAMASYGITTGGDTHRSLFFNPDFLDYNVQGEKSSGEFPSPQEIIELSEGAEIPGAQSLIELAKKYDKIATFDYEPSPLDGFSLASVSAFRKKYRINEADFERLHQALLEHGRKTYLLEDPEIKRLYGQWVDFRTWQAAQYIRRLTEAAHLQFPKAILEVTTNDSYEDGAISTLSRGYNAACIAPHVDAILPQLYNGYGGAAAKLTATYTRGWRKVLDEEQVRTKLYPVLLIRYAGASVNNSPQRMRQQIFSTLSEGAEGFFLYYPTNMDAPYWLMLAKTTREIKEYESFYQQGKRVDKKFALTSMPNNHAKIGKWPDHYETVENPQWHFTAHEKEGRYLLTLFNLQEANDLPFKVRYPQELHPISTEGVEPDPEGGWLVKPQDIGFIILEK